MSKVSRAYSRASEIGGHIEEKKKPKTVREVPSRLQADVVMILPNGKKKTVTAEYYKKNGAKLWKEANTTVTNQ